MSLFSELFTAVKREFSRVDVEAIPVAQIKSAVVTVVDGEYGEFRNVCFNLINGAKSYAKISKESEYYLAEEGTEVPVSGEVFRLADQNGEVTKTIYWEEA